MHFSETKDFCEMFKIMKFCAIVLYTCTGTWTSCTCTSCTGTGTCTCCTCTWWHSTYNKTALYKQADWLKTHFHFLSLLCRWWPTFMHGHRCC